MKKVLLVFAVISAFTFVAFAEQHVVDADKNCVFMNRNVKLSERAVRVKLSMNTRYRVSLSGAAFFTDQTGPNADPMPGAVIFYPTNEQDGFAILYRLLKPGETIRFTTPNEEDHNVFLMAFVMDYWDASPNRGKYILTVEKD